MTDSREVARRANEIEDELGLNLDAVLHKLTQEVGEFNDAVQKFRGIYCKKPHETLEPVIGELGDLYFNLISVCHRLGIDVAELPAYGAVTLEKFEERIHLYRASLDNSKNI
ncbi:hypothetical protein GF342_05455 [Candidatus Woesearchaeota archaeon]|nr:hypothetical protein [Candidatus Woesearchaeota archaeon]